MRAKDLLTDNGSNPKILVKPYSKNTQARPNFSNRNADSLILTFIVRIMYIAKWKIHASRMYWTQQFYSCQITRRLRVFQARVLVRVKFYMRVTRAYFVRKSAILHAFYARVDAAIPVASTAKGEVNIGTL